MAQNNPTKCHVADGDPPGPQDQEPDVAMPHAAGDGAPHGGPDNDGHPDPEPQPNPEAPGPGDQGGQQPKQPQDNNAMVGGVPPEIVEQQECRNVLVRIGFSPKAARAIVQDHGYDTAEKLSRLKPDNVDILMKTIRAPGGERADGT